MKKRTLMLAVATLMAFSTMANNETHTLRENGHTTLGQYSQLSRGDKYYERKEGFLLHLGSNIGLCIGAGYQFNPHLQAYVDMGIGGMAGGARFYSNEKKWSFMADLSAGLGTYTESNISTESGASFTFGTVQTGPTIKGIVGLSYKTFDFGIGTRYINGRFGLAIMAEWNIRFGKD